MREHAATGSGVMIVAGISVFVLDQVSFGTVYRTA
ncbi:hypothetical protein BH10ACT3_BH10ACT3_09200 [soil metagenome]